MNFALGQRWISDTESDLGLGTVIAQEGRMITLLFPASGETRLYSQQEAPLTRVSFNVGDEVKSAEGFTLLVQHIAEQQQLLSYHGIRLDTGEEVVLRETFLDHFLSFNKPQDRLFAGQIDRFEHFPLRYQSWQQQQQLQQSTLRGLVGGRVSLIPHQLHIARDVAQRHAPRVLLADEVGLGKTIEAGLIIHQQLLTGLASRVLIVVPESLQHQWLVEMLRRFNLRFAIFDEERCQQAQLDADNPFDTEQLVLCSMEFLAKKKSWHEQAVSSHWDLLVVDEAHHLHWHPEKPSIEYQRVEALAQDTAGLILLTATPDQLGHQSHFARLRLLDPERFYDYEQFQQQEQDYQHIAELARHLLTEPALDDSHTAQLQQLLTDADSQALLATVQQAPLMPAESRELLLQKLLDRHGTGRILFRNSRSNIKGFPQRHAKPVALTLPEQYQNALKVQRSLNKDAPLAAKIHANLFPEQVFQAFEGEKSQWWQFDPRVNYLLEQLKAHKRAKFLVICAKAATALALEEALRLSEGIRAAVFHEGMSIVERDKAAAYFAQEEYSAQVLICSEIGSEGRNFQFANHLVLFDLPLNPDLLEQRIGRLDRIGQQQDIQIHIPYFTDSAQQLLVNWYQDGLNAFARTCQTGRLIFEQQKVELESVLADYQGPTEQSQLLITECARMQQQLQQQLEQGRDQLLELNSSGGAKALQLCQDVNRMDEDVKLPMLMFKAWDLLGVAQEDRSDTSIILRPSEQLQMNYPGLDDEGTTVTFDRATALAEEDIQFLSWDHPMVTGTLDILTNDQLGNSAVALLPNKALPVGSFFVELIYIAEGTAPAALQLGRYLPQTPLRLLLDKSGKDLAAKVPFDNFNRQLRPVGRQTATKLVNALQNFIHPLLAGAEQQALGQLAAIVEQAQQQMQQALSADIERLQALREVNPLVRQEEIDHLTEQQQQLAEYLQKARLKLDAIRLIIVSHD
ncbi:RNA polymerase-associated protein RapA [Alishewanella longhuensis]|uniref:RNA polymerase-associated protein RapA n=1 Tax=Alishewanella longhuensis TaxID=1091037 RepID=A0ABQ3KVQ7_9ALTE|nr:RNA polymerase-associated protein RapA [Alishewanella longhuensis]GHG61267.1 RNA polymerase-associated protein RapA [Alishewanella longhuensis]